MQAQTLNIQVRQKFKITRIITAHKNRNIANCLCTEPKHTKTAKYLIITITKTLTNILIIKKYIQNNKRHINNSTYK